MSLHIGNLSAHTRGDDLKHVFWRFGRCNLRLKDRYGFVEYDFVQDAKKALRALQGRKICGEHLTLTWSRKQPKPFHGNPRGVSSYELQHEGRMNENDWQDYELDNEQPDSDGRRFNSVNMRDDDRGDHRGDIQDYNGDRHDFREGLPDDIGRAVPKLVDTGRWGEQVHDPSNANGVEFDRYEPHQDHDRKYEDENCRMAYSGGGFAPRSSQENVRIKRMNCTTLNHSSDMRSTCFSCGASGHKIRNCPRKYSSGRKLTRFDNRQDDAAYERSRGEAELERMGSRSVGEMQLTEGTASRHMNGGMASGSGKHKMVTDNVSSPTGNENNITEIKDHEGKKRSRREGESPKGHGGKKARRSVSSSPHSRYAASRLRSCSTSQSSKSVTRSGSQSRSNSASRGEHHSVSYDSRLLSTSKSSKSRSRSSSSISLSVSLSPSPFSSNKAHTNIKASAGTPKSKEIQVKQRQPVEGDACIEKADDENTMDAIKSSHAVSSFEAEVDTKNDHPLQMNGDGENHTMSRSIHEVTNPGTPLPEIGSHTTGSLSPEGLSDVQDRQNSNALMIGHVPSQSKEPASETPIYCTTGRSTSISSDELCTVLKHYGLELPEESERHLPMEGYFGSARLWPWEVINYRRVKKGLISVENYARRVAQNQEFGIVDKYIRSSSGWGEIGVDNP